MCLIVMKISLILIYIYLNSYNDKLFKWASNDSKTSTNMIY